MHLGKHNLQESEYSQRQFSVGQTIVHPRYNPDTHDNDIMLVQLKTSVVPSQKIQPLPLKNDCSEENLNCQILGWGKMENGQWRGDGWEWSERLEGEGLVTEVGQ